MYFFLQNMAPERDEMDEAECLSIEEQLRRRHNLDRVFQLTYFVVCGIVGCVHVGCETFNFPDGFGQVKVGLTTEALRKKIP